MLRPSSRHCLLLPLLLLVANANTLCKSTQCNCTLLPGEESLYRLNCTFSRRQRVELVASGLSGEVAEVEIAGGKELKFGPGVFSRLGGLRAVTVRDVHAMVYVQKGSFGNLSSSARPLAFTFANLSSLVLEEHSFGRGLSPVDVSVLGVAHVSVRRAAFSWLGRLLFSRIPRLDLHDEAFVLDNPKLEEPFTKITLEEVKMESIGRWTFHSPVREVRLVRSEVKVIRSEAFSSMDVGSILVEDTSVHRLEERAFSSRTLVRNVLSLSNVVVHDIAPNAVLSGLNSLAIHHSKLGTVRSGAINVTVASVTLKNNVMSRVMKRGFYLKDWNSISIKNNTFKWLDREAFTGQFLMDQESRIGPEYNFTGNVLHKVDQASFDFDLTEEITTDIEANHFNFKCNCDMRPETRGVLTGPDSLGEAVFETGLCTVDRSLSHCFQIPTGPRNMANFTETVCEGREHILCEEVQRDAAVPAYVPGLVPSVDQVSLEKRERERKVVASLFLIVTSGMLLMMALSGFMWLSKRGYCAKARLVLLPSEDLIARFFSRPGPATPTGSAHSVSRISVHEYAELQRKTEEAQEEDVPQEDKATQTLPEELTQELLQSLKEKLDDPDNYKEARDMIEHLYDLIKVEESCNRNEHGSEEVYEEVIRPSGARKRSEGRRSVGTEPLCVCEYTEPVDRKAALYAAPASAASLCDYSQPPDAPLHLYVELPPALANRPLPDTPLHRL